VSHLRYQQEQKRSFMLIEVTEANARIKWPEPRMYQFLTVYEFPTTNLMIVSLFCSIRTKDLHVGMSIIFFCDTLRAILPRIRRLRKQERIDFLCDI